MTAPQTPPPDTKDWTWVLQEACPACGFDAGDVAPTAVAGLVRDALPRWQAVLGRADAERRPEPTTWSPTEYACHVRDVFDVFAGRLDLMLRLDGPTFPNWDQDATALEDDYASQHADDVSPQLVEAGERAAAAFDDVPEDAWGRNGFRSNGSSFTVATLAQYFAHDLVHHLHDVDA